MSQAGIINVIDNNPTIPIYFEGDTGFAVALFNTIRIVGDGTNITTAAAGNTITINLAGATFEGLTPDQGAQVVPVAGNINVFGQKAGVVPVMETHNVAGNLTIEDRTWETQYVVDASTTVGLQGTYSTVQAAINQAVADGASISNQKMIYVRYGTYIEDLTIPSGIFLKGDAMVNQPGAIPLFTEIQGNHTFGDTNVFRTENIYWTNTDPTADMFSAATVIVVTAVNSVFNNGTSTGYIFTLDFNYQSFTNCIFYANGFQPIFNFTGGQANFFNCVFPQSNGMNSAANLRFYNCITVGPIVNSNGSVIAYDTSFNGNTNCITGNGSSILAYNCQFNSASDCVDYTGQLSFANCFLTNGAGENLYAANQLLQVVPAQAGQILPVVTQNANFTLGDSYVNYVDTSGGAIIATLPYNTTIDKTYIIKDITGDAATNNITIQIGFPGGTIDGAATLVLDRDYGAVCLQKTRTLGEWTVLWNNADSSSFFSTITGNTGGPISPIAGNLDLVNAGTNVPIAGTPGTLTQDFALDFLVIGTTAPSAGTVQTSVGVGYRALEAVTNSTGLTAVGNQALLLNSSGAQNTAVGGGALAANTTSSASTAVGWSALSMNTQAGQTAVGWSALGANTTGSQNAAFGYNTLATNQTGAGNVAVGFSTLPSSTGNLNTAVGGSAGLNLTTGSGNILIGQNSGVAYTTSESNNILLGGLGVIAESNTIRIGQQGSGSQQQNRAFMAGIVGTTVTGNFVNVSASGQLGEVSSGSIGQTITGNTGGAISPSAGNWNLVTANATPRVAGSGSTLTLDFNLSNLALGTTMPNVTTGAANVGMGGNIASGANSPLTSITSGSGNVAIGWAAGSALNSGANNVIIGQQAGKALTTGIQNNAIGSTTLLSLTTGSSNTANGQNVFPFLQTGSSNTGVGVGTGFNYNGAESSNILIANNGANGESNTLRIGSQGSGNRQVNRAFVAGIVGVTVSNTQQVTIDSTSGQLGVQSNESSLVTTYTANGTWTKNARTKTVRFLAWGGGGGGGSGRCGASGAAGGGGGGAGGGFYDMVFNGADLTASPYTVTIGVGGTGGASVNAVTTNGNPGNPGTNTTVGSFLLASGSPGGSGGTTGSGAGGTPSYMTISGITTQVATGTAGNSIAAAAGTNLQNSYATGGGGGSGYLAATPRAGGVAGSIVDQALNVLVAGGLGGSNAGATAGNGNSPVAQSLSIGGTGGGGGGNNGTSTAGAGGNGALPGGGGGGGGGNLNSNPSGAGGNGANGYLVVIEYF